MTTWPEYAVIRAEEMAELTAMAEAAGVRSVMASGAEEILTALAQLSWDAQEPQDGAALARQLSVQELIALLAAKGLRQATGERTR